MALLNPNKLRGRGGRPAVRNEEETIGKLMAKLRARTVEEALFLFAGTAFRARFREVREVDPERGDEDALRERLRSGETLDVAEVEKMPRGMQRILYRLLSHYVINLHMTPRLGFPVGFLDGTSFARLGKPVVTYLGMKWWPLSATDEQDLCGTEP